MFYTQEIKNILRILIASFCTIFCFSIYAQNIKVSYEQTYFYDYESKKSIDLFIDINKNSSLQIISQGIESDLPQKENNSSYSISASLARKVDYDYLLLDLNNKTMDMYSDFVRKFYKVEDVFPEFKWELTKEIKKINGIEAHKAFGFYRGKKWEVWFAPSIPHSFGPWKFNGLPGLVLDVKDELNNNYFKIKKIEYNVMCKNCEIPFEKIDKEINITEFLLIQDKIINFPLSDMPRGVIVNHNPVSFLDLEVEFEFSIDFSWERVQK